MLDLLLGMRGSKADNFGATRINLVSKGLHGQNSKGFFHLRRQFFNAKQKERQDKGPRNHHDVIPRRFKGIVQAKGQQEEPDGNVPRRVTRIKERHG